MRDSDVGRTHYHGDGCQPPHPDPDWSLPSNWLAEDAMQREHARNLRREADEYSKRYWQARSNGDLTPAECEALETARWLAIEEAARIERALRELPELP